MNFTVNPQVKHLDGENYITTIMRARGFSTQQEIEDYLSPREEFLYNPLLLKNMDKGATLLNKHLTAKSKIALIQDCDADGLTSSAIMYNYIKKIAPDIEIEVSIHSGKQHGIELNNFAQDAQLIICPDAGSSQLEEHKQLSEAGYDILVLDHHLFDKESEYAVIINNQDGSYPNRDLSGAGVVYKFISYYDQKYGYNYADTFLDLAAIGIIGDVMNLTNLETRYILKRGLSNIHNFGLVQFLMKQSFSVSSVSNPTPTDIAFYIIPLINAVIRVGTQDDKHTLFRAFTSGPKDREQSTKRGAKPGDTEVIADKAARIATNLKNHQNKEKDESVELIKMKIEKEGLDENKILIVALDDDEARYVNPNLTGLVAMRICQDYQKPTLVLREGNDEVYKGSARCNDHGPINDFRQFLLDSGDMDLAQGHANAFGAWVSKYKLYDLTQYANRKLKNVRMDSKSYFVDFDFYGSSLDELDKACRDLAPLATLYGKGIEEPHIIVENLIFAANDVFIMGKDKSSAKIDIDGVAFVKFKDTDFIDQTQAQKLSCMTIYGKMNLNEYNGRFTPQVIIEDYEIKNANTMF